MRRALLVLASLATALVPATAHAMSYTVTVLPGCTVTVWAPTFTITPAPPGLLPGITPTGTTGAETDCP